MIEVFDLIGRPGQIRTGNQTVMSGGQPIAKTHNQCVSASLRQKRNEKLTIIKDVSGDSPETGARV
jgi:hypothetical protein